MGGTETFLSQQRTATKVAFWGRWQTALAGCWLAGWGAVCGELLQIGRQRKAHLVAESEYAL